MGCTLAQPDEYDWTVHVRRRCRCGLFCGITLATWLLFELFQERSSGVVIVESRLCFRVVHAETFRKYTFIAENAIAVVRTTVDLFESEFISRPTFTVLSVLLCLDWLIYWVKVLRPTRHKIGHFGDVPQASLLAWYGKTKSNTTKAHIRQSKEITTVRNKHTKN